MIGTIQDVTRKLFHPRKKMRALSSSVVQHDRFDDGVLDDFTERAAHFRGVIENAPQVVPTVPMPHRQMFDTDDEYNEAMDKAVAAQERADQMAEDYSGWPYDVKDIFRAYHTYDEPHVKDISEIRPSRELGRQVMQRLTMSDAFVGSRPHTRHSDVESALATMTFAERLREELETTLAEHCAASQEAGEQETQIDNAERLLENLRQQAKEQYEDTGQVDRDLSQQIQEAVRDKRAAQDSLTATAERIEGMSTSAIAQAVEEAAEAAEEAAEMVANMPGNEPGAGSMVSPEQMLELAQEWAKNSTLRKIAELMGRMKRDMRFARAQRVQGGREEVVDFEYGATLDLVLPSEMALLMDADTELEWMRRYAESGLLQYEMVGTDDAGRGPLIVACDGSGSMSADLGGATRNEWSRSVGLCLMQIAHAERRDVAFIEYGSGGNCLTWFFPAKRPMDPQTIMECACHHFGGGTDATLALNAANDIILSSRAFKNADIVLISDGEDRWGEDDATVIAALKAKGVRIQGVSVGLRVTSFLSDVCDVVTEVLDMAHAQETARSLAVHMT